MEDKPDNVDAVAVVPKWQRFVRQQSQKICTLADNVVLPKNERISHGISKTETIEMATVDEQASISETEHAFRKSKHFPIFMIGISIVQIIIFCCFDDTILMYNFGYDPRRRHEIWRFFTVVLVHGSYFHLWGNLVMQLVLGVFLEIAHKWKRIAVIYLASGFGGSICTTILDNAYYSVGASGAVMGLLFAHFATIILNWREMDRKFTRLFCVLLYIGYDVGTTVYEEVYLQFRTNTSHAGHFGGSVTGLLVSILVLKNFKKLPWEETLQKICFAILISILVIVFVMNIALPDYFPSTEWNFDYQKTYDDDDDY